MRKADIFDEILLYLRETAGTDQDTRVDPALLMELASPVPVRKTEISSGQKAVQVQQQGDCASAPAAVAPVLTPLTGAVDPGSASWEELSAMTADCHACPLHGGRHHVVFGDGNPDADLMFIGEGPGEDEDRQGLPFVGRAGELLTKMISAMGFRRKEDVYIANVVKCRPPGNRTPTEEEGNICRAYLFRQIELVQPKVIVLLGATPLLYLLGMKGISRLRGQWQSYRGIKVMPTFHPAFLLRDPGRKIDVWHDLQLVMKEFGKVPQKPSR